MFFKKEKSEFLKFLEALTQKEYKKFEFSEYSDNQIDITYDDISIDLDYDLRFSDWSIRLYALDDFCCVYSFAVGECPKDAFEFLFNKLKINEKIKERKDVRQKQEQKWLASIEEKKQKVKDKYLGV